MVIGGSASTGSSLLMRILDRHSKILAGPETSLLARPQLSFNWERNKGLICGRQLRKLRNPGWHRYYGIQWDESYYSVTRREMCDLAHRSPSFQAFITSLKNILLARTTRNVWIEKTPANVYHFNALNELIPGSQFVLTVRHPADAIASMIRRGMSPLYAAALFLLNTAFGLDPSGPSALIVKYEELVSQPRIITSRLLKCLGCEFENQMLSGAKGTAKMKGWNYDETAPPGTAAVGSYHKLDKADLIDVSFLIHHLKIPGNTVIAGERPAEYSLSSLCQRLGYELPLPVEGTRWKFVAALQRERWLRFMGGYGHFDSRFPVYI